MRSHLRVTCISRLLSRGFLVIGVIAMLMRPGSAQSYSVIHSFTGAADGAIPTAGLTMDAAGNLYGTAQYGGDTQDCGYQGCGTVFRLTTKNGSWIMMPLYAFKGGNDSAWPASRVVFGPDGALYGTTKGGTGDSCSQNGCGTVFRLTPPTTFCRAVSCPWTESVLYRFTGIPDGAIPSTGDLVFDGAGNIYGTTSGGGAYGWGTVYKLTHSNGVWTESVIYAFTGQHDGGTPNGVIFDHQGNLYGTTAQGGYTDPQDNLYGVGVIFELTPSAQGWAETVLYTFRDSSSDGGEPAASLTMDSSGNFYGTTYAGGGGICQSSNGYITGCGTVFQGTGDATLYAFNAFQSGGLPEGPLAPISIDAAGNLYGTSVTNGTYGWGNVFKLSARTYTYSSIYDFTGGVDGGAPVSNVVMDATGNLYGTSSGGGGAQNCILQGGCGVVWKITP